MVHPQRSRLFAALACVVALAAIAGAGNARAAFLGDIVQPYDTIRSANALLQVGCNTTFGTSQKRRTFTIDLYTYSVSWDYALEVQYQVYRDGRLIISRPFTRVGRIGNLYSESSWVSLSAAKTSLQVFEQFRVWTARGWVYAPYGQWEIASHSTNGSGSGNSCTLY